MPRPRIEDQNDVARIAALKTGDLFKVSQDAKEVWMLVDGSGVARFPDGETKCAMNMANYQLAFFHRQLYVLKELKN